MTKKKLTPQPMLAPVPSAMISCGRTGDDPNIITLAWVGVACSDPPMLSIAVRSGRFSYDIIKETGEFVVNIPTVLQAEVADACGTISGKKVNKFSRFGLTPEKGALANAPGIKECPISLECLVRHELPLGSHNLFVGEVVNLLVEENVLDEKDKLDFTKLSVLGFSNSQYLQVESLGQKLGFSLKK